MLIREATVEDVRAISETHVRGWRWGYRDLFPSSVLEALSVEDRIRQWHARLDERLADSPVFVVVSARLVVGFAAVGPSPDDDMPPETAELQSLYVDEAVAGTGVGRLLMTAASEHVRVSGGKVLTLWVEQENRRARRFYEAAGFDPDGSARQERHPLVPVVSNEVRYRRCLGGES